MKETTTALHREEMKLDSYLDHLENHANVQRISLLRRMMLRLGGFDTKVARLCTSSEVGKLARLSSSILIPAMLGFVSFGYAAHLVFGADLWVSLGIGAMWSMIVVIIDRNILSSGRLGEFSHRIFWPRFLLAVTIGVLISEPLVLALAHDVIQEERTETILEDKSRLTDPLVARIAENAATKSELRAEIAALEDQLYRETAGLSGSGKYGNGVAAQRIAENVANRKAVVTEEIAELDAAITRDSAQVAELTAGVDATTAKGIFGDMQTLSQVDNPYVAIGVWVLRFFFVLIELLPLLFKVTPQKDINLYYIIRDSLDRMSKAKTSGGIKYTELHRGHQLLNKTRRKLLNLHVQDTEAATDMLNDNFKMGADSMTQLYRDLNEQMVALEQIEALDDYKRQDLLVKLNALHKSVEDRVFDAVHGDAYTTGAKDAEAELTGHRVSG